MILAELYKAFIKQRLVFFFVVLLLISCVYRILAGYDTTDVVSSSEVYYNLFFEKYEGKISEKKIKQIKNEYRVIETDTADTLASKQEKQAFESFYHIYLYEVDSGSGYLTDTRGWETILCHDNINFLLVIFIVLLAIILFSTEYENEMDIMIISTCGKNLVTKCKILVGIAGSITASVLFQLVTIIPLLVTVGLKNGSYPLNTIEFFENTHYSITLGQAFLFKFVLNIFGSVLLVSLAMFFVVLFKKREISIVLSIFSVMLPTMIFSKGSIIYKIPGAASLLSGSGFLWPDIYTDDLVENKLKKVISFEAIDKNYLLLILFGDIILMIIFLSVVFLRFSHYDTQKRKNKKILPRIIVSILLCFCLTACGKTVGSGKVTIDGSLNGQISLKNGKYVYYIDQNENTVYRKDAQENIVAVTRNVFPLNGTITNIFVSKNKCYYLLENDNNTNITVYSVDLESFEQILVYSTGSDNTEDFYGLTYDESLDADKILKNIATVKWFFVTSNSVYYQKDSIIYRCSLTSGREYIIDECASDGKVRYENGVLYYIDAHGKETSKDEMTAK